MASPKELHRLSEFAPLIPLDSRAAQLPEDLEEQRLLQELDQTLQAQQLINQHLQQQQEQVEQIQIGNHHVTARLEDALKENAETEKLRAQQSKMKGIAAGTVVGGATGLTGIMAGPAALVTVPVGAGLGAGVGWGIGSLFTGATTAAVNREMARHEQKFAKQGKDKDNTGARGRKDLEGDALWADEGSFETAGKGTSEDAKVKYHGGVPHGQQGAGQVIISFRCCENQRYAKKTWDHGNLTTGERGRWWVESDSSVGQEERGSPAVLHPEPILEPEFEVTWLHDWLAEDVLDANGTPREYSQVGPEEGWLYAPDWRGPWTPYSRWNSYVRKRRWLRIGTPSPDEGRKPRAGSSTFRAFDPAKEELLGPGSGSVTADPNERLLQKLRDIKEALGEGSQLLYLQGEQLRDAEKQTLKQIAIAKTTGKVQGMSSFHNVILSYLNPATWFPQKPPADPASKGNDSGIKAWESDGWEFEGREATVSERLTLETHGLSRGTQLMSKELDLQAKTLDNIESNQDKVAAKVQKLTRRVEKQL